MLMVAGVSRLPTATKCCAKLPSKLASTTERSAGSQISSMAKDGSHECGSMYQSCLCSGGGGLDLGLELALGSLRTVCWVEWEAFAIEYLAAAMEAGCLVQAPVWTDLRTFDGRAWRGVVDCLTAGYPCQPFSVAGKRRGEDDPRHLWPHVCRVIGEVEPAIVFLENVPGHLSLGFEQVACDLQAMGYAVAAGLFTRRKSVQATSENGFSSSRWQTIKASDGEKGGPNQRDGKGNPYLPMQAALLRSPTSSQPGADVNNLVTKSGDPATTVNQRLYRNGVHRTVGLPQQAVLWKTPNSVDWKGANPQWEKCSTPPCNQRRQQTDESTRTAPLWATPRAEERRQYNSQDNYVALSRQAPLWPTPNVPNGGRTVSDRKYEMERPRRGARYRSPWPGRRNSGRRREQLQAARNRRKERRNWAG